MKYLCVPGADSGSFFQLNDHEITRDLLSDIMENKVVLFRVTESNVFEFFEHYDQQFVVVDPISERDVEDDQAMTRIHQALLNINPGNPQSRQYSPLSGHEVPEGPILHSPEDYDDFDLFPNGMRAKE